MSPAPAMASNARSASSDQSDKRSHQRYPITLDLDYKVMHRGQVERLGSGRTVNISRANGNLQPGFVVDRLYD